MLPKIGITAGDPAGIGPEVVLKALAKTRSRKRFQPILFGDPAVFRFYRERFRLPAALDRVAIRPCGILGEGIRWRPGVLRKECGRAAVSALHAGAMAALTGEIDALVTAPVQKEALHAAGWKVEGQTELFGRWTKAKDFEMVIEADALRVLLLTRHLSLREALGRVKKAAILARLKLGDRYLRQCGSRRRRIAVAGLNPHAGEGGLFGSEERNEILPAISAAKRAGLDARGVFSPDTVFRRAKLGEFDLVLALYHDQAFIPVKTLAFDRAVTTIAGIPFPRVSVIHGTAFDIAGRGVADATNMMAAIERAVELAAKRSR